MSDETLLIEQGAIETRAARMRNGEVVRSWFGPAFGAESRDLRPIEGRAFTGRVCRVDSALDAVFIDIGADRDAFLPIGKAKSEPLAEGAMIEVRVIAAPRRSKGAVVDLVGAAGADASTGRLDPVPAPLEAAAAIGGDGVDIVTDGPAIKQRFAENGVEARMAQGEEARGLFAAYGVDQLLDAALRARVSLPGGGALHFSETEALVAIDVDTGAAGAASADRLREKAIAEAAREAMVQIERRNLSGRIVIDFPSIRARDVRARAVRHIEKAISGLSRVTSKSIAGSNFTVLARERRGASLWDETTEPVPGDLVPGRRFTLSWLARCAVREAERRQGAAPGARLGVRAGKALEGYLQELGDPRDAYFARWGAPLEIARDDQLGDRTFEIVER